MALVLMALVTYAATPPGWIATQRGSSPTGISAILLLTSLPFAFLTLMIETLLALRLTTARYYTPSGRSIQAKGIDPDVAVLEDVPDDLKGKDDTKGEASL